MQSQFCGQIYHNRGTHGDGSLILYRLLYLSEKPPLLKVSSKSSPNSVAGAIAGVIRDYGCVEVQAVGAGATNQALKSIAVARGYLAPMGIDLVCIPAFTSIDIDGIERTAMKLIVETR